MVLRYLFQTLVETNFDNVLTHLDTITFFKINDKLFYHINFNFDLRILQYANQYFIRTKRFRYAVVELVINLNY